MRKRPERIVGDVARRLGLLGLIATVLVALLGVLAPAASASPTFHPQTRVAAIEQPTGQVVGLHSSVLADQGRERAPNYDRTATGSSVAAEGGAEQVLYRADSGGPEDIFANGFEPKGTNTDLWQHVTQNPPDSGFVSTSNDLQSTVDFANDSGVDYVYRLRASGIDVNAGLGSSSPFPWENEVAVPGSIPGSAIEGVWGPSGWIGNPDFVR